MQGKDTRASLSFLSSRSLLLSSVSLFLCLLSSLLSFFFPLFCFSSFFPPPFVFQRAVPLASPRISKRRRGLQASAWRSAGRPPLIGFRRDSSSFLLQSFLHLLHKSISSAKPHWRSSSLGRTTFIFLGPSLIICRSSVYLFSACIYLSIAFSLSVVFLSIIHSIQLLSLASLFCHL